MHYFKYNIGNYRRETMHLTPLEHGIYRNLMDTYYLTEQPLNQDKQELMRTHCIRSADEMQAFENVLNEFFELTDAGYCHEDIEEKIAEFQAKSEKCRAAAKKKWASQHDHANASQTHSERNANHKPLTINHKPINKRFKPPTQGDIFEYFLTKGLEKSDASSETLKFFNFYESKGWMVGKNKMKNWNAAASGWLSRRKENEKSRGSGSIDLNNTDWAKDINDDI